MISILIKFEDKEASVIFKQKRVGKDGKVFYMYKFRTMIINAENLKCNFTEEQKIEFESSYKLKKDPRVTPFGGFLRKTSLDELPQIFNVLKGEMSFVGPRPIVREECAKYGKYAELLMSVKPGITGLWQISGRNSISYENRVKLDVHYIKNNNFLFDLKIFFKTFKEVALRLGAY